MGRKFVETSSKKGDKAGHKRQLTRESKVVVHFDDKARRYVWVLPFSA
jgi:hypothetical protein